MSVHDSPIYSNNPLTSIGKYTTPNNVEKSLNHLEVNSTPVSITAYESEHLNPTPQIEIKPMQNPIKPSGNVNNLATKAFKPLTSDSTVSSSRPLRKLTNRKGERTKETPVALKAMPKIGPKNPVVADSPPVAVPESSKRFGYTSPNKPPPHSLLDAAKAAGFHPHTPSSPQAERTYIPRKLRRMPNTGVPPKTTSAAPKTTSAPNSPASPQPISADNIQKPKDDKATTAKPSENVHKPGKRQQIKQEEEMVKKEQPIQTDQKPVKSTASEIKSPHFGKANPVGHEKRLENFKNLVNDRAKIQELMTKANKSLREDELSFLLKVNLFKDNFDSMPPQARLTMANHILKSIHDVNKDINIDHGIKKEYPKTLNDANNLKPDYFDYVMSKILYQFMFNINE